MKVAVPLSQALGRQAARLETYHGACACGEIRFKVVLNAATATPCICQRCRGTGLKIAYANAEDFRLITGAQALTEPLAEARTPHHFFCARCGEPAFGYGAETAEPKRVSVNVACLNRGAPEDLIPPNAAMDQISPKRPSGTQQNRRQRRE